MAPKDTKTDKESLAQQVDALKNRQIYLSRMIRALDEKNAAARKWMDENRKAIIMAYGRLDSAIADNDREMIRQTFSEPAIGVTLDITDKNNKRIGTRIAEAFADDTELQQALTEIPLGIPQQIFSAIDEEVKKDINDLQTNTTNEGRGSSWLKRVSGQEGRALKQEIKNIKTELLGIENQPAFAKALTRSLFDWVEAGTIQGSVKSENPDNPYDFSALLKQADDADFVIRLAQNDFNETLRSFADSLAQDSRDYVRFVTALSQLNEKTNRLALKGMMAKEESGEFSTWALIQLGKTSLTEYAFEQLGTSQTFVEMLGLLTDHSNERPLNLLFPKKQSSDAAYALIETFLPEMLSHTGFDKTCWTALKKTCEKSGASFKLAVIETSLLKKIYDSTLSESKKQTLIADILDVSMPEDFSHKNLVGSVFSLLEDPEKSVSNLRDIRILNSGDFAKAYALTRILSPDSDPLAFYLESPTKQGSAESFMSLWSRGVTSGTYKTTLKTVLQNTLQSAEWIEILPRFYDVKNTSAISEILFEKNTNGETLFDQIYQSRNIPLLNAAMAFLAAPVERANFYHSAAENTGNTHLKMEYSAIAAHIDGDMLEYADGHLLNPAMISNVYYTDDGQIHIVANGHEAGLPGVTDANHAAEIFFALQRKGLMTAGHELINPAQIDYIECNGDELKLLSHGQVSSIGTERPAEAEKILKDIADNNPDFLRINDSLINTASLTRIFFDENDCAHFLIGDICIGSFEFNAAQQQLLHEQLSGFQEIGSSLFNIRKIEAVSFDDNTGEVQISASGILYNEACKISSIGENFSRYSLPAEKETSENYAKIREQLTQNAAFIGCGSSLINPEPLAFFEKNQSESTGVTLFFENNDVPFSLPINDQIFSEHIRRYKQMPKLDYSYVDFSKASNIYQNSQYPLNMALGKHRLSFQYASDKLYAQLSASKDFINTGSEIINPKNIVLATPTPHRDSLSILFKNEEYCLIGADDPFSIATDILGKNSVSTELQTRRRSQDISQKTQDWSKLADKRGKLSAPPEELLFGEDPAKADSSGWLEQHISKINKMRYG